jgi:hypothetical protein
MYSDRFSKLSVVSDQWNYNVGQFRSRYLWLDFVAITWTVNFEVTPILIIRCKQRDYLETRNQYLYPLIDSSIFPLVVRTVSHPRVHSSSPCWVIQQSRWSITIMAPVRTRTTSRTVLILPLVYRKSQRGNLPSTSQPLWFVGFVRAKTLDDLRVTTTDLLDIARLVSSWTRVNCGNGRGLSAYCHWKSSTWLKPS